MTQFFSPCLKDGYKIFHKFAYNPEVTHVYSNFTNRHGKHSNIPENAEVMFVGLQYFILDVLIERWNTTFFRHTEDLAVNEYSRIVNAYLGKEIDVTHLRELHQLGYMPLEIKALPEGTMVPYGVPCLTIVNTVEGFGWLTNMIETVLSAELWGICTSATTSFAYRKGFQPAIEAGLPAELLPFMAHDFSYRGMFGTQAAAMSGFGHLCSFAGSDTLPAGMFAERYYGARIDKELVLASVDATEHSVMCSYGTEGEKDSLEHLITNVTPTGIISIVSDTWDFWKLVTEYLPELKEVIMAREGTVVIRPDSGDPVKILTGMIEGVEYRRKGGVPYPIEAWEGAAFVGGVEPLMECEVKGLIECLYDTFGGTKLDTGYIMLDSHIGAIYGDSITLERQKQIIERLLAKGFVPSVVLGIGSYSYQYVTRDTHGSAMKATDVQLGEGNHMPIFKDPKTDQSKKSAKGLLMVQPISGELYLVDDVTPEAEASEFNELKTVFKDGKLVRRTTLAEIRERVNTQL